MVGMDVSGLQPSLVLGWGLDLGLRPRLVCVGPSALSDPGVGLDL